MKETPNHTTITPELTVMSKQDFCKFEGQVAVAVVVLCLCAGRSLRRW
jgi:hypothetical protein